MTYKKSIATFLGFRVFHFSFSLFPFLHPFFLLTCLILSVTCCNATMTNTSRTRPKNLGEVEQLVMDYLWTHGPSSSEACREALATSRPMKDSTIRTVLRRLEEKGYLTHETEGRTFIYKPSDARQNVAVRAVKSIIDRFCGGSAEQLVLGMVDNAVLDRKQLERLARKIAEKKEEKP
jgi:BlaI family transcriptional regulator, penicillinase repressor